VRLRARNCMQSAVLDTCLHSALICVAFVLFGGRARTSQRRAVAERSRSRLDAPSGRRGSGRHRGARPAAREGSREGTRRTPVARPYARVARAVRPQSCARASCLGAARGHDRREALDLFRPSGMEGGDEGSRYGRLRVPR